MNSFALIFSVQNFSESPGFPALFSVEFCRYCWGSTGVLIVLSCPVQMQDLLCCLVRITPETSLAFVSSIKDQASLIILLRKDSRTVKSQTN